MQMELEQVQEGVIKVTGEWARAWLKYFGDMHWEGT